jgi:hypothetical protein
VPVADEPVSVAVPVGPEVASVASEAVPLVVSVADEVVSVAVPAGPEVVSVAPEAVPLVVPVADEVVSMAPEVVVEAVGSCAETLGAKTAKRAPSAARNATSRRRLEGRSRERLNGSDNIPPRVYGAIHRGDASLPAPHVANL